MPNKKVSWEQKEMEENMSSESESLFGGVIQDFEAKANPAIEDWNLIGKPLGSGSFGVTFLAAKTKNIGSRKITIRGAIKLVNLDQGSSNAQIKSLVEELTKLSKFHSRYIANLIDAGTFIATPDVALPYFVMDYIQGDNLFKILESTRKKELPAIQPAMFKNLALNTLRGLLTAHEAQILHLDIKPANIMFSSKDETFVLIDFGVSRFIENDILDGFYGGTVGYMAPEVFIQKASHASDVFSLGITFYEALTLEKPFKTQARLVLQQNPNSNTEDTKFIQSVTKNMKFNFELLSDDQRALIEPMLQQDPIKRPSVDQLIELANKLSVPDNSSPQIAQGDLPVDIYESWEQMGSHITNLIKNEGVGRTHIIVDDNNHFRLWFKTKTSGDRILISCPSPKNTVALGQLGWNARGDGAHVKEVDSSAEDVSDAILKAMKIGLSLKPPVSVTRGHSY
jgi:serine/threonine protein kinase